jgi:hypothetical protein
MKTFKKNNQYHLVSSSSGFGHCYSARCSEFLWENDSLRGPIGLCEISTADIFDRPLCSKCFNFKLIIELTLLRARGEEYQHEVRDELREMWKIATQTPISKIYEESAE